MDPRTRLQDTAPTHREDAGRKNSRKDEEREAAARARAAEAAPVPGLQAGDAHAGRRTGDLARATAAGPQLPRDGEDHQISSPTSQRGTTGQGRTGRAAVSGSVGGRGAASGKTGSRGGGQRNRG